MRILRIVLVATVFLLINSLIASADSTCFRCHDKDKFAGKVTHKPVVNGDCQKCHNPHVAKYKKLLTASSETLCYGCHEELKKQLGNSKDVHKPFADGDCLACHDPHSSSTKGLIRQGKMSTLCFGCHKTMVREFKTEHRPFATGNCQACHNPHYADRHQLLNDDVDQLCVSCHGGKIGSAHKKLPVKVKESGCVTCHSPHGSDRAALIRNVLHEPYQEGCAECHANGQIAGAEKCLECHDEMVGKLSSVKNHQTNRGGNGCINCHSPHASDTENMLKNNQAQVCRTCHPDTWDNYIDKPFKHPDNGICSNCHDIHGSNNLVMLKGGTIATCDNCHETQGKFTHPVGPGVIDPRNGMLLSCVTCHYPHGTIYKQNLKLSGALELCIQCHKTY